MDERSVQVDSEIIESAKSGDEAALSKIVDKYQKYLLFLAQREMDASLAGRTNPSDVVQDTFAKLPKTIGQFNGQSEAELKAWLRTTLGNTLKDTRRYHHQLKRAVSREVELESNAAEDSSTPSRKLENKERFAAVKHGLEELGKKDQELLRLRHDEGLSFAEIGQKQNISADAARIAWGRAIQRLRKLLSKFGDL